MSTIRMVIRPSAKPGLVDCDALHLRDSRTPLCDGARALLAARAAKRSDTLELARRQDGPWDIRARVGWAADRTVKEEAHGRRLPAFVRFAPGPSKRAALCAAGASGRVIPVVGAP